MSGLSLARLQRPGVGIRNRPAISQLQPDQLETLRSAFHAMQGINDERGYQYHAGIHGLPLPKYCKLAHGQPIFLAWHRAYLYVFEMALRAALRRTAGPAADALAVPWWDWRMVREVPAAYTEEAWGNQDNPLRSVQINQIALQEGLRDTEESGASFWAQRPNLERRPGLVSQLPTNEEIQDLLKIDEFTRFQRDLEEKHGWVHRWVGGHMGMVAFAAYDPIFWAHHTMIDRIWRLWQRQHPGAQPPISLDTGLAPFQLTVGQVMDVAALGYDYVVSETEGSPQ